jgi:hypothetical protein
MPGLALIIYRCRLTEPVGKQNLHHFAPEWKQWGEAGNGV